MWLKGEARGSEKSCGLALGLLSMHDTRLLRISGSNSVVRVAVLSITIPLDNMNNKEIELSNTLFKGRITEVNVLKYFLELGYVISTPEISCQYDFLLDTGKTILKIQVKTCRVDDEAIEFNTSSITHNAKGYTKRLYSPNTVDYFCTYYNNECYLIPLNECGSKAKKLRFVPTKNGQVKNISFAKDYIAKDILFRINESE